MKTAVASKVESIQLLRAIAVILVVYVHILDSSTFVQPKQKDFFFLENWGAIGLDLFFVISGFIMTVITPGYLKSGNWKDFLARRALRIIPLYWLLSAFSLLISMARGSSFGFEKIMKTLLFLPVFEDSFTFPIIPVGWSLSLEIYFYFMIAALLPIAGKNIYKVLILILLAFPAAGFFLNPTHQLGQFLCSPLLIEFALGIMAGRIFRNISAIKNSTSQLHLKAIALTATIGGFSVMLISLFTGFLNVADAALVSEDAGLALFRSLVWGIPSAIFLTGFVMMENLFEFRMPAFLVKLGDASYSCYLLHTTIFIPIAMKAFKVAGFSNGDFYVFFSMAAVLGGSLVFYSLFEKPMNSLIHNSYISQRNAARNVRHFKSPAIIEKLVARFRRAS